MPSGSAVVRRLDAYKAGEGVYAGKPKRIWRPLTVRGRPGPLVRWRRAVDDADLLEPFIGAERAWALAARAHNVTDHYARAPRGEGTI